MPLRIAGLSGFDVDNTVKELMKAQAIPLDKLDQKKQTYEWQRDAYRDVNLKVTDFRNNKLFNFKSEGTFNKKEITVTGNADAVTAKPTASAISGSILVNVTSLATPAGNFSQTAVTLDGFDPTKPLSTQSAKLAHGTPLPAAYKFKINGSAEITIDPTKESLNDVITKINSNTNVSAFYDDTIKKLSFVSKETGLVNGPEKNGQYIIFDDTSGNFLSTVSQVSTLGANKTAAANASVTINGLPTTRTSNTFRVNGIDITLNKAGGGAAAIEPRTNTEEIMESIKTFVSDYNDVLKNLQDKTTETKDRSYTPLTREQKSALSEAQIDKWEERAKMGLIKGDSIVSGIINNLRTTITSAVDTGDSTIRSLSDIGIKTGQYFENGKLYVEDENKLRAAIERNPEAVKALFTQDEKPGASASTVGITERLYSSLKVDLDKLTTKAGLANTSFDSSTISLQITQVTKEISIKEKRLQDMEDAYYIKFAAMESAMNRYNSQSQYLANQFGGGSSQ
ncbi:MAG: flagellar hook-associated 2 protein [Paenibacillus sp.]|nr:flagellar hook-associated 2 protein [Paenibacillus sp.]